MVAGTFAGQGTNIYREVTLFRSPRGAALAGWWWMVLVYRVKAVWDPVTRNKQTSRVLGRQAGASGKILAPP